MLSRLKSAVPFAGSGRPTVTLVPLHGVISADQPGRRTFSAQAVESALSKAFSRSGIRAVVLSINSPGGSPAQSRAILGRARELSKKHNVPVIAHIEEIGASGGYMIALAGDEIYADPFAIVGSIGVIAGGFGFKEAIDRLGIERRVYTAGAHKGQLDPFREENPRDVKRLEGLLEKSHDLFIDTVKGRRGGRLKGEDDELFNGDFWLAGDADRLGLIDGAEGLRELLHRRFGDEVRIKRVEISKGGLFSRFFTKVLANAFGAEAVMDAVADRTLWARFGQ